MDYKKAYDAIILRAKNEDTARQNLRKCGNYFESHHIVPKSFGGSNKGFNRALLTAREHFICHWLLVKIYPVGTEERKKMLIALWRMGTAPNNKQGVCRYRNARAYEALRKEFAETVGMITAKHQQGEKNSRYGSKWYTSYITGESKVFYGVPTNKEWIPGRNVFNGKSSSILYLLNEIKGAKPPKYTVQAKHNKQLHQYELRPSYKLAAQKLWDEFHSGNYESVIAFARTRGVSQPAIRKRFNKFIPIYANRCLHGARFKSNIELVGVYE